MTVTSLEQESQPELDLPRLVGAVGVPSDEIRAPEPLKVFVKVCAFKFVLLRMLNISTWRPGSHVRLRDSARTTVHAEAILPVLGQQSFWGLRQASTQHSRSFGEPPDFSGAGVRAFMAVYGILHSLQNLGALAGFEFLFQGAPATSSGHSRGGCGPKGGSGSKLTHYPLVDITSTLEQKSQPELDLPRLVQRGGCGRTQRRDPIARSGEGIAKPQRDQVRVVENIEHLHAELHL